MNNFCVLGASGHAKVVIDLAELNNVKIFEIFDQDINKKELLGYPINHDFSNINRNTIVAIGNNEIRRSIVEKYDLESIFLIHPSANISKYSFISNGTVIMAGVSINAGATIGKHVILNTNCSIDHDCVIGDFVHISPNASLAGNVVVGNGTHIGIGACVKQGVRIGENCIIGAGAVIIRDVSNFNTIVGNPGKVLLKK